MDNVTEFLTGFQCSPPEWVPKPLGTRLTFLSCLAHKPDREVYLTIDAETGGKAVLKITKPDSPDSGKREYELLSKLDHPSIPRAFFYHQDEAGREYLIRQYFPGDTLDFLLERDGRFDARSTLETVKKLCGIMSYLHRQSPPIVYRDIKPQNIIMTPNGKVSLIDFGISREDSGDKNFDTICVGSTAFAAPEMYGFTKSDSRTDIFTLGRLALYLNTGNYNPRQAMDQVAPKELLRIIRTCTELSPEKRYASVERLEKAIDRVLYPPTRKEIAVGAGTAALCLTAGLIAFSLWGRPEIRLPEPVPVGAGGTGYEQEVQLPVQIETVWAGRPFSDCAVAIDNHHWYQPQEGRAELYAFAYDEYKIRAVTGNRTAFALSAVTKDTQPLSFRFDLAQTPSAPELIALSLPYGKAHEVPLEISGADAVTFTDPPAGVAVEKRGGQDILILSGEIEAPGHYVIFAEATNEHGKADVVISLMLQGEEAVTVIRTARELDGIRENLSGYYILGTDIDLGEYESWTPIGTYEAPFTGVFDGNGHSITGMRIQGKQSVTHNESGLFGVISHGVIRNTVMRGGNIYTALSTFSAGHGLITGRNIGGLIEHCAVFDSKLSADIGLESGAGGICGVNQGIVRNCWSEAEVTIFTASSKDWTESSAGGICGINGGYLEGCGNTGPVTGISLAGGVAGFNDMGILTRCYNAGYVKSPAYFGSYLAGGVSHLLGRGKVISYCAFEQGTAQVGASVFNGGTLLGIVPVEREVFRDLIALGDIFHIAPGEHGFAFASLDSYYPVPDGIFARQTAAPTLPQSGPFVKLGPAQGVKYFYTLDGSDPHAALVEGVESIDITLEDGETMKVFAAQSGYLDSETVEYRGAR